MMLRHLLPTTLLLCVILTLSACVQQPTSSTLSPLAPEMSSTLQPGLLPRYFAKFLGRNIGELPDDDTGRYKTRLGEPIPKLDNQFGRGEVFGSGSNRGVGIRMRGFLHFPVPGAYTFQALSNDGIKMYVSEMLVVNDPVQHSDQLSPEATVTIPAAGWYPLRIDYFQRKGTAALKLSWKTPEKSTMEVVPASAYAHLPAQ